MSIVLHVLSLLALAGCALSAPAASSVEARIEVDRQPDRYELVGIYTGPRRDGLQYRLEVTRESPSGRSRSAQSGEVRGDTLSQSSVNVSAGDHVTAHLTILEGSHVIAEALLDEVVGT